MNPFRQSSHQPPDIGETTIDEAALAVAQIEARRVRQAVTIENAGHALWRVANAVAAVEASGSRERWARRFFNLMRSGIVVPNPTMLTQAGSPGGNLMPDLSIVVDGGDLSEAVESARLMHAGAGAITLWLHASQGAASVDEVVHTLAALREADGAPESRPDTIAIHVSHPGVAGFLFAGVIPGIHRALFLDAEFMRAVRHDLDFELREDGEPVACVRAKSIWTSLVEQVRRTGSPTLLFAEELPVRAAAVRNFISLNVDGFFDAESFAFSRRSDDGIAWERLRAAVTTSVRMLDDVFAASSFALPRARSQRNAEIVLMGFADLMARLGVSYGAPRATGLAARLVSAISQMASDAARELAHESGRSLTVPAVSVLPVDSCAAIAGCSRGADPLGALLRAIGPGEFNVHGFFFETLGGEAAHDLLARVAANDGSCRGIDEIDYAIAERFVTERDIRTEALSEFAGALSDVASGSVCIPIPSDRIPTRDALEYAIMRAAGSGNAAFVLHDVRHGIPKALPPAGPAALRPAQVAEARPESGARILIERRLLHPAVAFA